MAGAITDPTTGDPSCCLVDTLTHQCHACPDPLKRPAGESLASPSGRGDDHTAHVIVLLLGVRPLTAEILHLLLGAAAQLRTIRASECQGRRTRVVDVPVRHHHASRDRHGSRRAPEPRRHRHDDGAALGRRTRVAPAPQHRARAAIDAAHDELERRARAATAGDDLGGLGDVVVAVSVTPDDLDRVPDEWRGGLKVEVRPCGTLVAMCSDSNQRGAVVVDAFKQVHGLVNDAAHSGPRASMSRLQRRGARGVMRLDVHLRQPGDRGVLVSIAVFEVGCGDRSCPQLIASAARYCEHEMIECVVCSKFFPARVVGNELQRRMGMPALVIVFRRANNGQIRVDGIRSFGNEMVHGNSLHCSTAPNAHHPLENPFQGAASAYLTECPALFPHSFVVVDLTVSLTRELAAAQGRVRVGEVAEFRVVVPALLSVIRVDLLRVFAAAVHGWNEDQLDEEEKVYSLQ